VSVSQDDDSTKRSAAGPVAGEDPPPSQAAGGGPTPAPPADESSGDHVTEDPELHAKLNDLLVERNKYLDLAKRAQADFENYRKRARSEVQAAAAQGQAAVIREVVPVLDDLERALQVAGLDPEGDSEDGLAHGVLLVFRGLRETLARNGVEAVDPKGEKFDPNLHEALSTVAADGAESGTVVEVVQKGYRLGDQLVRPARVVVAE
jgi:molecular chaperone GrpE